ncbi:MAG: hypothetical protein CMI09_09175 [Oceanospirillaceae bacterium]|nr:hypothetical protein [Oceanospirillaceae bacterium]|tara:strand:+ start:826 stop:1056 length:231 start_codon:yes stop_codon:yes gene_type:complete
MPQKVEIDGIEYIEKPAPITPPPNKVQATHWAVLPDDSIVFYRVTDEVLIWLPYSGVWDNPGLVPYTLYSYDKHSE